MRYSRRVFFLDLAPLASDIRRGAVLGESALLLIPKPGVLGSSNERALCRLIFPDQINLDPVLEHDACQAARSAAQWAKSLKRRFFGKPPPAVSSAAEGGT